MVRGFTLLELMIVVVIAAILLTVAIPGMTALSSSMGVDSQLTRIMRDAMFARNQALNIGSTVRICTLDSSDTCAGLDNTGYTIFADADNDSILDTGEITLATYDEFKQSSTVDLGARTSIRFNPEGLSTGTNATLTYCSAVGSKYGGTVTISQLGNVSSKTLSSSEALTACASS